MNAYELADELEGFNFLDGDIPIAPYQKQADMLRQQADRIAELEQNLSAYIVELELHKAMIQDLEKQSKPIGVYDGKNVHICTPQTKPLSDEEIDNICQEIACECQHIQTDEWIYRVVARAIEERHGIK